MGGKKRSKVLKEFYKAKEIMRILEITARQFYYWNKIGLIRVIRKQGKYLFKHLLAYKTTKTLLDSGISLQMIRKVIKKIKENFPEIENPLIEIVLWSDGKNIYLDNKEHFINALSGQGTLYFFINMNWIKRELESNIIKLREEKQPSKKKKVA